MFSKLQEFFNKHLNQESEETSLDHKLQLASAALMVEMIHVDENVSDVENVKIRQIIKQRFELAELEIEDLISLAVDEKHEATDYYAFTSLLNTHYSQPQKVKLVQDLWQIAYADKQLDKHEEHLVRRLADLLHVAHRDFIHTKHKTLNEINQ